MTGTKQVWQEQTCSTSIEGVFKAAAFDLTSSNFQSQFGVYVYDSTNSKLFFLGTNFLQLSSVQTLNTATGTFSYSGTGNPSYVSQQATFPLGWYGFADYQHLKIVKSGSSISYEVSLDGGATYQTIGTQSVGTISDCGYFIYDGQSGGNTFVNILSEAVN